LEKRLNVSGAGHGAHAITHGGPAAGGVRLRLTANL